MFGKMGEMGGMLKKVYEMKKDMEKIKEELLNSEVKGSFGASVEVIATGGMKLKSIKIAPEIIKQGNTQEVEDMVLSAVNNALEEAKKMAQSKMSVLTGGINIPGLF
ncbi:MAG TPA: YbaB/EbfC family nucleoid-associated protein [Lentisphaeria bacterium]|nr:MAG: nucleoid-associated protein, YbaB/EbfC family [Lentisphaerae bacterium GWF2_38_69]HBM16300.1 YbaB/EbfC family nucleoid-associated protein [Lentisphaeria bacterium]